MDRRTLGKRMEGLEPDGKKGKSPAWLMKNVIGKLIENKESEDLDPTQERARKDKEAADRLEMENQVRRNELLERDAVDAAVIGAFSRVRTKLLAVPTKAAPVVVQDMSIAEAEALLRSHMIEALQELADTNVTKLEASNRGLVEDIHTAA